ncbi:MAG: 4-hydroxy-tetrahydrodipicolinate reductase [Clostridia bacterium]|nr:4-hydroxy-tetrahydrodipicolinate reductase [Clostridia bacterium]
MNILISGILGHMGKEVEKLCREGYRGARFACGVDINAQGTENNIYPSFAAIPYDVKIDCIVDFSHHTAIGAVLDFAKERSIPAVIATTGHTESELMAIKSAAKSIPVFFSANMSLGVALLVELAKTAAAAMPEAEIEIIEKHHNRKLDAPSGTALMLANALCEVRHEATLNLGRSGQGKRTAEEIGIHAIRMGNIVGEHEVILGTQNQTITIKHEAHSRALFAEGALAAAAFIYEKGAGLYDMNSLVGKKEKSAVGASL